MKNVGTHKAMIVLGSGVLCAERLIMSLASATRHTSSAQPRGPASLLGLTNSSIITSAQMLTGRLMSRRTVMPMTGTMMILIAWMPTSGSCDWYHNHPKMGGNVTDLSGLTL
jgi:hypothetical protein